MIEVKNLVKDYGKVVGANNVSLTARPGELTVLLGENGAGKSTTIKSIIGLLEFQGNIEICGYDNKSVEAKKAFGYIPETPILYDLLTIDEHIEFIGKSYRLDDYEIVSNKYLDIFHLQEKRKTVARELSKGMRQKLSMVLALMLEPQALLVDEPMMGLDPKSIEETLQILVALKKENVSILMSTHIIDMVNEVWDRAYIMQRGVVVKEIARAELDGRSLKDIYFEIGDQNESTL
ncbi:ABC transporter ATP-binding protein [Erysipelothrix sp. HDW6C]|uniref:ABC transporter ATP-binding protein n=1 Tax=Erysipelothrix sp. HDW6C TaxID=2714930 RepID=UPI0014094EFF|nr:ABC transporter ATP-binding protein [Erysipelothrix sp. HDW6C]QIK70512.1 ABC transporter ATP-binding protein [Erysipelothrix sp. HDW6C]